MIHTFELSKEISKHEYKSIDRALFNATKTKPKIHENDYEKYSVKTRQYKMLPHCKAELLTKSISNQVNKFVYHKYKLIVRINPAKIVFDDYIHTSDRKTAEQALLLVNNMFRYLEIKYSCDDFDLHRIDYAWDVRFASYDMTETYLKLIKKGDIPGGFKAYKEFSPTGHRMLIPKSSYYCYNGSVTINIYTKYDKTRKERMENGYYEGVDIEKAKGILRFEIQCNNPKINTIKKTYNLADKKVGRYLDKEISKDTLLYYLDKVCGSGDYHNYSEAKDIIRESGIRDENKEFMLNILKLVNKKKKWWYRTKEKLLDERGTLMNFLTRCWNGSITCGLTQ